MRIRFTATKPASSAPSASATSHPLKRNISRRVCVQIAQGDRCRRRAHGGDRAVHGRRAREVHIFQPVEVLGIRLGRIIGPGVREALGAARPLRGDHRRVELRVGVGRVQAAIEVESLVVQLTDRLPGDQRCFADAGCREVAQRDARRDEAIPDGALSRSCSRDAGYSEGGVLRRGLRHAVYRTRDIDELVTRLLRLGDLDAGRCGIDIVEKPLEKDLAAGVGCSATGAAAAHAGRFPYPGPSTWSSR